MPELFLVLTEVDPSMHDQYDMHFILGGMFTSEDEMEHAANPGPDLPPALVPGEHTVHVIEWDLTKDGRPIVKGSKTRRKKLKV